MYLFSIFPNGQKPEGRLWPAFLVGVFVSIGGMLFGYDTASISGMIAMDFWVKQMATHHDAQGDPVVTTAQVSLVVSIVSVGTFCGALIAGFTGDLFGRRWGLILACTGFNVGAAMQTAATGLPLFIAGRIVAGLGVGLISALVPLYQSECVPKWFRGTVVGTYQLSINLGLIVAAVINNATGQDTDSRSYRIPSGVQIIFGLILSGGLLCLPETPSYLIKVGKRERALKSLTFFHGLPTEHPKVMARCAEIEANLELERSFGSGSYLTCWKPPFLKRTLTGCGVQAFQQLAGVSFIFYYGTSFFKSAGLKSPFIIALIINIMAFVSTIPGLYLVERLGRRRLLLIGAVGMTVSQFIVAIVGATTHTDTAGKVIVGFVCIFIIFWEFSWGPGAWIITAEIFPLHIRARCMSFTTATAWLFNWALAFAAPYMVNPGPGDANLGAKVFFVWASFCFIAIFWTYFFIYETKGLTLEEIDEMYLNVDRAYHSPAYHKTVQAHSASDLTDKEGMPMNTVQHVELPIEGK